MNTELQAEKLSLLARDLALFPESMDSVLQHYKLTHAHLAALEENPVFQAASNHALQQLVDDPLYPVRLKVAGKAAVLAERLLNEAIAGTMDHQNSIKVVEYASKIANMEPPKVTKANNTNTNSSVPAALDPTAYRQATASLTNDEIMVFEKLLSKMQQGASALCGVSQQGASTEAKAT